MSSKRERKPHPATSQEEETRPDAEHADASAAEVSPKAADTVDAIDEVLEDFDNMTLAELGFRKEDNVDPSVIGEAIAQKVAGFQQKNGQ